MPTMVNGPIGIGGIAALILIHQSVGPPYRNWPVTLKTGAMTSVPSPSNTLLDQDNSMATFTGPAVKPMPIFSIANCPLS